MGIPNPGALPLQPMLQTKQHGCRWHSPSSRIQDVACRRLVIVHVYNVYMRLMSYDIHGLNGF